MKKAKIKHILFITFSFIVLISSSINLIQRYFWLQQNEINKIKEYIVPSTESLGKIVEFFIEKRVHLLCNVAKEISINGLNNKSNITILKTVKQRNDEILSIGILDLKGIIITFLPEFDSEGKSNIGKSFSDREYFLKVKKLNQPVISEVIVGRILKKPLISLIVPIYEKNEVVGYVLCGYDIDAIKKLINTYVTSQDKIRATLVDENGKVIFMSHSKEKEFEEKNFDLSSLNIYKEAIKKKDKGIVFYKSILDNKKKIGSFYYLKFGWIIWISVDTELIQKNIMSSYKNLLFFTIFLLLVIFGLTVFLSNSISKPLLLI